MEAARIIYNPKDGFSSCAKDRFAITKPDRFERCWSCPQNIGKGNFQKIEIRSGFDIWISDCLFEKEILFYLQDHPSVLVFGFWLSGHARSSLVHRKKALELSQGQQGVFYFPHPAASSQVEAHVPMRCIEITIRPEQLFFYLEDHMFPLPEMLQKAVRQECDDAFWHIGNITPAMHVALHQIVTSPYCGLARRLYLESRALELIAHQLSRFSASAPSGAIPPAMHSGDRERVDLAKKLLVRDMEHPPGLKELARAAGMSHPKLNRCFRRAYGMTAFQYLRNERLNRAREMLEKQGMTVTETSYAVGYDSISHFSQAYKKRFGISPGIYSRKMEEKIHEPPGFH